MDEILLQRTLQLRNRKDADKKYATFHGDKLIGNETTPSVGLGNDLAAIFSFKNIPAIGRLLGEYFSSGALNPEGAAQIAGSLSNYSKFRQGFIDQQVKAKYDRMLHPPLTYLGDAFQYRTADGKFNSALNPHLGQAGAPYAKTVPSKTAPLGALPDPGDLFDKLMARKEGGRESESGLSSMLLYHATIIIHDIFRTNDNDKNISDSSSYLDLSPLYGYTEQTQREVRDDKYKLGLLRPDTFAEDRLLRQPPGVCIMLVMYNRYHNYAAKQLYRINENGRFSVPTKFNDLKLVSTAKNFWRSATCPAYMPIALKRFEQEDSHFFDACNEYSAAYKEREAYAPASSPDQKPEADPELDKLNKTLQSCKDELESLLKKWAKQDTERVIKDLTSDNARKEKPDSAEKIAEQAAAKVEKQRNDFEAAHDAAWNKLDDDLFNTARLITCGIYIQISVHDYLRALMGFHAYNTDFTLDPRTDFDQRKTTRGIGNQVTVEFNLLYRFHCAISGEDEKYTEAYIKKELGFEKPAEATLQDFLAAMARLGAAKKAKKPDKPWEVTFGIEGSPQHYERNKVTNLFDDQQMIDGLTKAMDQPIGNFGPCNVPQCLKAVEIMGITQARRWEVGTLNDFREFFGMSRHQTFESISKNTEIQNALRDLYEHPDKVELYPGIFCESDERMNLDPGPRESSSALWAAIFSDAITLVRSDRFYTVDWNTNSLTSWGMNEVTPNSEICKSSVFHRLIQRAFPGWFQYDSIRFFHPFYTAEMNEKYAKEQGYGKDFNTYPPSKPEKPVYLSNFDDIFDVLENPSTFQHPALRHLRDSLPASLTAALTSDDQDNTETISVTSKFGTFGQKLEKELQSYLDELMLTIAKRESVSMTNATFQIDATRDFAIPVVTRYVADFLGFGHTLRTESNPRGTHTENDIYQHITNCQIFLAYNPDETKTFERAKAFKQSIAILIDLTKRGNVAAAHQWNITRVLFGYKQDNPMTKLGFEIAREVLQQQNCRTDQAAAILVLVCLDLAYCSVMSFTAVLDDFMTELYQHADSPGNKSELKVNGNPNGKPHGTPNRTVPNGAAKGSGSHKDPTWFKVQELAFGSASERKELQQIVQETARRTVRLPILRVCADETPYAGPKGRWKASKNQIVILDVHRAATKANGSKDGCNKHREPRRLEAEFLTSQQNLAGRFACYSPKQFSTLALTSMISFIAQMKNVRRGHDAQGHLKRLHLDWTAEGYSNFMASDRMDWIAQQVKRLAKGDEDKTVYTEKVLKPSTDTYLTPGWDEMVPFPMTWKLRYDGFGVSNYFLDIPGKSKIVSPYVPDDTPPWYQPRGVSHVGGSFADVVCTHPVKKGEEETNAGEDTSKASAGHHTAVTTGCGIS